MSLAPFWWPSKRAAIATWTLFSVHAVVTLVAAWVGYWRMPIPSSLAIVLGALLIVTGASIYTAGVLACGSFGRLSGLQHDRLITSGIYQRSRHPQLVGWTLLLGGIASVGRSGLALLLVAVLVVVVPLLSRAEEQFLADRFGEAFRDYQQHTARYWGRPNRASEW